MWICRQLLLEKEAGATASSATAKGLHFPCSRLCSLNNSDSGGGNSGGLQCQSTHLYCFKVSPLGEKL